MSRFRTTLLAALAAPALAMTTAQGAERQYESQVEDFGPRNAQPALSGHVRGTVTSIDYGLGQMTVSLGGGDAIVLRGTPGQLREYRRGSVADVSFEKYGDSRWLSGVGEGEFGEYSRTTTLSGAVSSVNKADGTVTLSLGSGRIQTFRAHPDEIRSLVPGQFISLTYDRVASHNWVTSVEGSD